MGASRSGGKRTQEGNEGIWRERMQGGQARRAWATKAATMGCELVQRVRDDRKVRKVVEKADASPVTVADFGAQAVVSIVMSRQERANTRMIAEESAKALEEDRKLALAVTEATNEVLERHGEAPVSVGDVVEAVHTSDGSQSHFGEHQEGAFWILDPIDGTRGFLHGGRCEYTLGLACVQDGQLEVGVMALPNTNRPKSDAGETGVLMRSMRNGGTQWTEIEVNGDSNHVGSEKIWRDTRVDTVDTLSMAALCVSDHETAVEWLQARGASAKLRLCCGSLCKYAAVALGSATAYLQPPDPKRMMLKSWDHAAGLLCVQEAGGTVTDLDGHGLEVCSGTWFAPSRGGLIVSNGRIHEQLLRLDAPLHPC